MEAVEFWHWLVLGFLFMSIEVFVPGAFFFGMGLAAVIVAAVLWAVPGLGWEYQLFWFALLSLVSIWVIRRFVRARPIQSEQPLLNLRGAQYVGRTFTLELPIINGQGKIKVDDSTWKITGPDCAAGTHVVITGVNGVVLQAKAEEPSSARQPLDP